MGKNRKTCVRMYFAWNYEGETEDLNRFSTQGWQLVHGGAFSSRFTKNTEVRFVYQLDYEPGLSDLGRYLETFREQGWEYVNSTFNGWHYFRKPYDPALPASDYEIFTDRASLREMNGRWAALGSVLAVLLGLCVVCETVFAVTAPRLPGLVLLLTVLVEFCVILRGVLIMRNPERRKRDRHGSRRAAAFLAVLILGFAANVTLDALRPHSRCAMYAEDFRPVNADHAEPLSLNTFEVTYGDRYYLDLELDAAAPVTFTIANSAGERIFTVRDSVCALDDEVLRLPSGRYEITLSDFSGGRLDVSYDID